MFRGELNTIETEEEFEERRLDKYQVRQYKLSWVQMRQQEVERHYRMETVLKKKQAFCRLHQNVHLQIRGGVEEALDVLSDQRTARKNRRLKVCKNAWWLSVVNMYAECVCVCLISRIWVGSLS